MAWIELHQNLPKHRKMLRFKRLLKIKTPQAVGHLCILWLWALDEAPDGDLSRFEPEEIAEVAEWNGKDPSAFVGALTEAGFLDAEMRIHDWMEYAGRLIEKRNSDAERKRTSRGTRRKYESTSTGCPQDVPRTSHGNPCDGAGNPNPYPNPNQDLMVGGNARAKCFELFEQKYGTLPRSLMDDFMGYISAGVEDGVLCEAVEAASDSANPSKYIRAVVRRCLEQGIKTLAQYRASEEQRSAEIAASKARQQSHGSSTGSSNVFLDMLREEKHGQNGNT